MNSPFYNFVKLLMEEKGEWEGGGGDGSCDVLVQILLPQTTFFDHVVSLKIETVSSGGAFFTHKSKRVGKGCNAQELVLQNLRV